MQSKIKKLKIKKSNINKLIAISSALLCCNIGYTGTHDCLDNICDKAQPITAVLKTDSVLLKSEPNKNTTNNSKTTYKLEWVKYKDLSKYYIEEFQKVSNQYFGGQSYEEFTKKRTLDSLSEKEQKVLEEAAKKAYLVTQKMKTINEQIIPIKQFIKKIEDTPAYNVLIDFIKTNAIKLKNLKKGEKVNFSSVLTEMSSKVQNSSLSNGLQVLSLQRSLIYSAISKTIGFKYYLDVEEETGNKIERLMNNNNVGYLYDSDGNVYLEDDQSKGFRS